MALVKIGQASNIFPIGGACKTSSPAKEDHAALTVIFFSAFCAPHALRQRHREHALLEGCLDFVRIHASGT